MLAIALAVVLIMAAAKPDKFSIERTTSVEAPPEAIFPLIDDFHQWGAWSPYENQDPAMKRDYSGAASGKGAVYGWEGNKMSAPAAWKFSKPRRRRKSHQARFLQAVRGPQHRRVHDAAAGRGYQLSWGCTARCRSCRKLMQVFMNLDHMIGKDFEAGLANLKRLAEK